MATNLKTGKKIRAFLYRMVAVGAFLTFIVSAVMGREALVNLAKEGPKTLTGEVYYLTEFREYISYLYQQGMLAYTGLGDDQGLALKISSAQEIQSQIKESFHEQLNETEDDILFYVKYKGSRIEEETNISYPIFSENNGNLLLPETVQLCCYWKGENSRLSFFDGSKTTQESYLNANHYGVFQYKPVADRAKDTQLILAIEKDREYSSYRMRAWDRQAGYYQSQLMVILSSAALTILFGLFSLCSCKYGKAAKEDYASFSKKIWLEVKLALIVATVLVWYLNNIGYVLADLEWRVNLMPYMWMYLPIGCMAYLLWTDVSLGGKDVFLNSILVKFVLGIRDYIRSLRWQRKIKNVFLISVLCSFIFLTLGIILAFMAGDVMNSPYYAYRLSRVLLVIAIISIVLGVLTLIASIRLYKFVKDCISVADKIEDLQKGVSSKPLKLRRHSLLSKAASELNDLESGIDNAVEQRNRANKMRVELITNVSHDLKTPLTSIINYADLLCEEPLPEPASDYAKALSEKAYRLKRMVQDVFDLSKATTGNLPVEKQRLDLVKLIRQTLADMDEKISESSLSFKLSISEEPLMIEADGDKLYRVFQNLFVNALQYSLEYSRVHIQLSAQDGFAVAKVKNTSKGELDFDTAEIIERFVRSDASRTTEGSGLGLSIVQSFTESCGGSFTIETDADMFTACVRFPLAQEMTICEQDKPSLPEEVKLIETTETTEQEA